MKKSNISLKLKYLWTGVFSLSLLVLVGCAEDSFVASNTGKKKAKEKTSGSSTNSKCNFQKSFCGSFTFSSAFIDKMNINTAETAEMDLEFKTEENNILSELSFYYQDQPNEYSPKKLYQVRYSIDNAEESNKQKNPKKWEQVVYSILGFPYQDHGYVNEGLRSDKKYGNSGWKTDSKREMVFITMYEKALPQNDYEVIILRMTGEEGHGDGGPISSPFKGTVWYKRIDRPEGSGNTPHVAHWAKSITVPRFGAYPGDTFLDGKAEIPGGVFKSNGIKMGTFENLE